MKPLDNTFSKNTFHYELVIRSGDVAIYKQRLRPGVGCLAYEVFKVKKVKECVIMGKKVEAHEAGPSNEDFGYIAWSYPDLGRAKKKMAELLE